MHRRTIVTSAVLSAVLAVGLIAGAPASSAHAAPAPSGLGGIVYGTLTVEPGGTWDGPVVPTIVRTRDGAKITTSVDGSGYFQFTPLSPDNYRLYFDYSGSQGWVDTDWAPPGGQPGGPFGLLVGELLEVNGVLARAATVSGTVSAPTPLGLTGPKVNLVNVASSVSRSVNADPATGAYTIPQVGPGVYRLEFTDTASAVNLPSTWIAGGGGQTFTVSSGVDVPGMNGSLLAATSLSGTVRAEVAGGGTEPVEGAYVYFRRPDDSNPPYAVTDENGRWLLSAKQKPQVFGTGDILVQAYDPDLNLLPSLWNGGATTTLVPGTYTDGFDVLLEPGATISGRVLTSDGTPADSGYWVIGYRTDSGQEWMPNFSATVADDGSFTLARLPAGTYLLQLGGEGNANSYFDGTPFADLAQEVVVAHQEHVVVGDIDYLGRSLATARLSGPDRYSTNVAISQATFPDGADVPVVYLATGAGYADALSAGPAAAHLGGGLLLTQPYGIPPVVLEELRRLDPDRIVIVGSAAAISESVRSTLATEFPDADLDRVGGADRYETSIRIVRDAFGADHSADGHAFFATGLNYPDALAAGPVAASWDAPVILVNGQADGVSAATLQLVRDLDIATAYFVGSEAAIRSGVVNAVQATVETQNPGSSGGRIAGVDRYETAYYLAWSFRFDGQLSFDRVLVASGANFPDALSGGPLAASLGVPLLLSRPGCLPPDMRRTLEDWDINLAILLGGPPALSPQVAALATC